MVKSTVYELPVGVAVIIVEIGVVPVVNVEGWRSGRTLGGCVFSCRRVLS